MNRALLIVIGSVPLMQPPFPVTYAPIFDWSIFSLGMALCLYSLRVSGGARPRPRMRSLALAVIGLLACQFVLVMMNVPSQKAIVLSVFVALMALSPRKPLNRYYSDPARHRLDVASNNAPAAAQFPKARVQPSSVG
jgi:hypothetical protein